VVLAFPDASLTFMRWIMSLAGIAGFHIGIGVGENVSESLLMVATAAVAIHGSQPRENIAEADLFKLLVFDLSTGHVIRQHRERNVHGQFPRKSRQSHLVSGSSVTKSAFDDRFGGIFQ
jgi:hypothetical protein